QRGRGPVDGGAAAVGRARDGDCPRRPGGAGGRRPRPARRGAVGHRAAGDGRVRGGPPAAHRAALERLTRGADRLRRGGGPAALERGRVRPPPRQAGGTRRRAGAAAHGGGLTLSGGFRTETQETVSSAPASGEGGARTRYPDTHAEA